MKVKLLRAICCPDGSFQPGNEPDLEESTAKSLINSGYAEALEPLEPESNNTTDDGADEPDGSKAEEEEEEEKDQQQANGLDEGDSEINTASEEGESDEPESNNTTDDGADEPDGSKAVPKGRRNSR